MTDFTDARIVRCPYCKTPFCEQEGTLCDCAYDMQDVEQEIDRDVAFDKFNNRLTQMVIKAKR